MFSDEQLNTSILSHLEGQGKKEVKQANKEKSEVLKLDCIVGKDKCLYKDKASLIKGQVTEFAEKALNEGKTVELPASSDLLGIETKSGQGIHINQAALDEEGRLSIDQILDQNKEDI